MNTEAAVTIDVRNIAPRNRHSLIFTIFDALPAGEALLLVNDHDPKPLHYQFQAESAGQFIWEYVAQGPEIWRVKIGKAATSPAPVARERCCGANG